MLSSEEMIELRRTGTMGNGLFPIDSLVLYEDVLNDPDSISNSIFPDRPRLILQLNMLHGKRLWSEER